MLAGYYVFLNDRKKYVENVTIYIYSYHNQHNLELIKVKLKRGRLNVAITGCDKL